MSFGPKPMCDIFLNGRPVRVPQRLRTQRAVRGALGVPLGQAVARELGELGLPDGSALIFEDGHEFQTGERYITVSFVGGSGKDENTEPWAVDPDSGSWVSDPDSWKG